MTNELSVLKPIADREDSHDYRRDIQRLEDENRSLRRDLEDALHDKERLERTIKNLRQTLSPFHRAFGILFGEMELAVGQSPLDSESAPSSANQADPRWQSYKTKFPGVTADIIDALLIHGEMGLSNLSPFIKRAYGTTKNAAYRLKAAGAVNIVGGKVSLKR